MSERMRVWVVTHERWSAERHRKLLSSKVYMITADEAKAKAALTKLQKQDPLAGYLTVGLVDLPSDSEELS